MWGGAPPPPEGLWCASASPTAGSGSGCGRGGHSDSVAADDSGSRCSEGAKGGRGRIGAATRGIGSGDGCTGGGMVWGALAKGRGVAKVDLAAAIVSNVACCAGRGCCEAALASAPSARQGAPHSPRSARRNARDDSEGGASPQPGVVSEVKCGEAAICGITGATGLRSQ